MARGIFGFKRLTGFGPFTFSQEAQTTEEIRELINETIEEEDIDPNNLTREGFRQLRIGLTERIYPDNGRFLNTPLGQITEKQLFAACLASEWAQLWEEGFVDSTTEESSIYETLAIRANGCVGLAAAGNDGIRVIGQTNPQDLEPLQRVAT